MARENNKRARLVEAADKLFHQKGVNVTTLANIATLSNVPLGNVYYYFKAKDAITMTVIEARQVLLGNLLSTIDGSTNDPRERLGILVEQAYLNIEDTVAYGSALGGLCQELSKESGPLADAAATLMGQLQQWTVTQLRALGKDEATAELLAQFLLSALLGNNLLTATFKDAQILEKQGRFLKQWVQTI